MSRPAIGNSTRCCTCRLSALAPYGNHDRVAEIRTRAAGWRDVTFIQQLQQHVPDVGMRLFDFVEQDDLERLRANRIEQARRL
jgi:hypothetical protein